MRLDDLKVVMIIMTKKIILIQIDINNTVSNVIKINPQTQPQQSLTKPGPLMTIMMTTTIKRKLHHQQC